jgi:hypothetical protein
MFSQSSLRDSTSWMAAEPGTDVPGYRQSWPEGHWVGLLAKPGTGVPGYCQPRLAALRGGH